MSRPRPRHRRPRPRPQLLLLLLLSLAEAATAPGGRPHQPQPHRPHLWRHDEGAGTGSSPPPARRSAALDGDGRNVFVYWATGFEGAPPVVALCVDSWRRLNPAWTLHLLTLRNVAAYVGVEFLETYYDLFEKEANFADLLRLHLLRLFGGVWADATLLALRPLESWLKGSSGEWPPFFLFARGADHSVRSPKLIARQKKLHGYTDLEISALLKNTEANWFIYSQANGSLIGACERSVEEDILHWDPRQRYPYYRVHALVHDLIHNDGQYAAEYATARQGNAYIFRPFDTSNPTAHMFSRSYGQQCWPLENLQALAANGTVQKLTWHRYKMEENPAVRHLLHLLNSDGMATSGKEVTGIPTMTEEEYLQRCPPQRDDGASAPAHPQGDGGGGKNTAPGSKKSRMHWLDRRRTERYNVLTHRRMMYSGPWQYHFYHIPKTGGETIEESFLREDIYMGRYNFQLLARERPRPYGKYNQSCPCSKWHCPPVVYDPFGFVTVRDVFDRIKSEFVYQPICNGHFHPVLKYPWAQVRCPRAAAALRCGRSRASASKTWLGSAWGAFQGRCSEDYEGANLDKCTCQFFNAWLSEMREALTKFPYANDCHFYPQTAFAKRVPVQSVLRLEHLQSDLEAFMRLTKGPPVQLHVENVAPSKCSSQLDVHTCLAGRPDLLAWVKEYYAEDFAMLASHPLSSNST